jgi:hypothetical protein
MQLVVLVKKIYKNIVKIYVILNLQGTRSAPHKHLIHTHIYLNNMLKRKGRRGTHVPYFELNLFSIRVLPYF